MYLELLVNANNGDMLKNMVQESDLKVSEEHVEAIQESKKSNFKSLKRNWKR